MIVPLQPPSELQFQFYNLFSKLDNTTASLKYSVPCMHLYCLLTILSPSQRTVCVLLGS